MGILKQRAEVTDAAWFKKDILIKCDSHRATVVRLITEKKSGWLTGNICMYQICTAYT